MRGKITGCDDDSEDTSRFDTGSGITQLRFPGDAFPVRNPPLIPDPLPMGLLAAHRRAKEVEPSVPSKTSSRRRGSSTKKIPPKPSAKRSTKPASKTSPSPAKRSSRAPSRKGTSRSPSKRR